MLRVAFVLRSTEVMPVFCVLSMNSEATGCLHFEAVEATMLRIGSAVGDPSIVASTFSA